MDHLIRDLSDSARVLDLGSGSGSFAYGSTRAMVIALDLAAPGSQSQSRGHFACASSAALPLSDGSVDVVVCNHTLEHFVQLQESILEINRVLREEGTLWVSVPDASCLDDRIYRFVFEGGGHVNRFSRDSLIEAVEKGTDLRVRQIKKLFSGFVYLNPPPSEKLRYFPRRARILGALPPRLLCAALRWFNYATRLTDSLLSTSTSQYGWGFVFQKGGTAATEIQKLKADVNVCAGCGAGFQPVVLENIVEKTLLGKAYDCPGCGRRNAYFCPSRLGHQ